MVATGGDSKKTTRNSWHGQLRRPRAALIHAAPAKYLVRRRQPAGVVAVARTDRAESNAWWHRTLLLAVVPPAPGIVYKQSVVQTTCVLSTTADRPPPKTDSITSWWQGGELPLTGPLGFVDLWILRVRNIGFCAGGVKTRWHTSRKWALEFGAVKFCIKVSKDLAASGWEAAGETTGLQLFEEVSLL